MEEDDGPGFVIKKRTKSRPKNSKPTTSRISSETVGDASATGDTGNDEDEGSAVIKRNVKSKRQATSKLAFGGDESSSQPKKSSGLRPALSIPAASQPESAGRNTSTYSLEDLDALKQATRTSSELTQAKFGHLATATTSTTGEAEEELIPTDNAIAAAKMKRDIMRKSGATAQDFIALDNNNSGDLVLAGDKGGESRLMREEDELGEGDEELAEYTGAQDRIAIGSKARKAAEKSKRAGIQDMLEEAQDDLEDLELRRWEDAQIRRSGHDMTLDIETKKSTSAQIPTNAALPTFSVVQSRLQASLDAAETAQQYNKTLSDQSAQLESLKQQETALRNQVTSTSARYEFFQAFQAWVEDDLVAFLDAKQPLLERLEQRNLEVQVERRHILGSRRMTAHACELAIWTRRPVLNDYDALRKASTATKAEQDSVPQKFISPLEASPVPVALSEAEESDLKAASDAMSLEEDSILADVQAEEFKNPSLGAAVQFKKWRESYPEEYKLSFAGLVLVQVWEFWARLEIARWNPFQSPLLQPSPTSLEQLQSHEALSQYAHETQEEENLFGALISNCILPKLKEFAPAYDPYDTEATKRVIALVDEVTYGVERTGDRFEDLVAAYMRPIQQVMYALQQQVLPLLPLPIKPGSTLFGQEVVQFLENAMKWRRFAREVRFRAGTAAGQRLEEGLVNECLQKVLLPVLQTTGDSENAKKLLALFGRSFALTGPVAEALKQI